MGLGDVATDTQQQTDFEAMFGVENPHKLILWNDDVNSFVVIIMALMEFLEIPQGRAEFLALKAHSESKTIIADGTREKMQELAEKFGNVRINVTVESPE